MIFQNHKPDLGTWGYEIHTNSEITELFLLFMFGSDSCKNINRLCLTDLKGI